ncbi:unnamed protein product [Fusarium graminearum]|nr:unnamed protein product [Fusarium graminearum]
MQPSEDDYDPVTKEPLPPLEIFEAGTGMGSLTLHLARALNAANPAVPSMLRDALCTARYKSQDNSLELSDEVQAAFDAYRSSRRAILHTLDQNAKHSGGANKLVRQFRRSLYYPTVDFHVGSISDYVASRLAETDEKPIFSHAILDLPSVEDYASPVIQALHPNGLLVVFAPSISQIARFQTWISKTKQPLRQERVIELDVSTTADGVLDTGGGKEWDVKTVVPRSDPEAVPVQVMRPKVGDRLSGGGFIGVYRRWPNEEAITQVEPVGEENVSDTEGIDSSEGIISDTEGKVDSSEEIVSDTGETIDSDKTTEIESTKTE